MIYHLLNSLRFLFLLVTLLSLPVQHVSALSAFGAPLQLSIHSSWLMDSVKFEVIAPVEMNRSEGITYPVIYLFDRQNASNYDHNLNTIDYLVKRSMIPACVIVGITIEPEKRDDWTSSYSRGGLAINLSRFLIEELDPMLKKYYAAADFNVLVGHSRTAIFSQYALSQRADFFRAAIASSGSNFDFGDEMEEAQFDAFLKEIAFDEHQHFLYISSGREAFGDPHEDAVDIMKAYLSQLDPLNLRWACYQEDVDHNATPGITVGPALTDIFRSWRQDFRYCLYYLNDSLHSHSVPWTKYKGSYYTSSKELGYQVKPDLLFYNSLASGYANDYHGWFGEKADDFTLEVLLEGLKSYPRDYDLHTWAGEVYAGMGNSASAIEHYKEAMQLIRDDRDLTEEDRNQYMEEIRELLKAVH